MGVVGWGEGARHFPVGYITFPGTTCDYKRSIFASDRILIWVFIIWKCKIINFFYLCSAYLECSYRQQNLYHSVFCSCQLKYKSARDF